METRSINPSVDEVAEKMLVHEASSLPQIRSKPKPEKEAAAEVRLQSEHAQKVAEELAEQMNSVVSVFNTSLAFSVDDGTGRTVIEVQDTDTKEVIRQIPPEHILQLIGKMRDVMGMVLNVKI